MFLQWVIVIKNIQAAREDAPIVEISHIDFIFGDEWRIVKEVTSLDLPSSRVFFKDIETIYQ